MICLNIVRMAAVGLSLAATMSAATVRAQSAPAATGAFVDFSGASVGSAVLKQTLNGVLITLDVRGLPRGEHALHLHAVGRCDAAGGFESAGAHFAPGGTAHGHEVAAGPHAGDMTNQFVDDGGVLRAELLNAAVTLRAGATSLFDRDGTALVIHADPDDYSSQPSGAAGDRIACAVITRDAR